MLAAASVRLRIAWHLAVIASSSGVDMSRAHSWSTMPLIRSSVLEMIMSLW